MLMTAPTKQKVGTYGRDYTERLRGKIKAGQILDRLCKYVYGEIEMKATQVRAAEILLRKCLPDLQAIQVTGHDDGPLTVEIVRFGEKKDVD